MKINFTTVLKALNGEDIMSFDKKPVTLCDICVNVLDSPTPDEALKTPGDEKYKRGKLAKRVFESEGPIDLTAEEVTLLKSLIGKRHEPHLVMVAWDVLDPTS